MHHQLTHLPAARRRRAVRNFRPPDRLMSMRRTWPIILLCILLGFGSPAPGQAAAGQGTPQPGVLVLGAPTWWVVPFSGNPSEGKLYFGATIENRTGRAVRAGLSFQSYLADGTRFDGCFEMGGGGPGVATEIAPRSRAFLFCQRSIVPIAKVEGLQVTSRLWDVEPAIITTVAADVPDSGLIAAEKFGDAVRYEVFARVRARGARDQRARVHFRLLSDEGVQLETCDSDDVTLDPVILLRVTCSAGGVLIPRGAPRPTRVEIEVRRPAW